MQSTGYQEGGYYASNAAQDTYAQSQQNMVYEYSQQQPQHGQMYSQATVYQ